MGNSIRNAIGILSAGLMLASTSFGVSAQEKFTLPQPDLSVVGTCVAEYPNDIAKAAQCYASFDTLCFDKWFQHYSVCLPQEVSYWGKALNSELQRSAGAEQAVGARRTIDARMAAQCPEPKARYRQVCEARYLRDNTVLLHMHRVWAEASATN